MKKRKFTKRLPFDITSAEWRKHYAEKERDATAKEGMKNEKAIERLKTRRKRD